jgi:predicted RND superfamily exporter protein
MRRRRRLSRAALERGSIAACRLAGRAWKRPLLHGALLLAVTAGLGAGAFRLGIDNRLEVWTGGPAAEEWTPPLEQDFVAVVLEGVDATDPRGLALEKALAAKLRMIEGIDETQSVSALLEEAGRPDLSSLGDGARFAAGWLLAADGRTPVLRAWIRPGADRGAVVERVERAAREVAPRASVVGPAAFNAALDRRSRAESARALPLALLASGLCISLLYRSWRAAAALLGSAALGVIWAAGAAGWIGVRFNFLTLNVPVIALVVGLALLVHPFEAWTEQVGRSAPGRALRRAIRRTFPGCALSLVTTVAGFAALAAGSVDAVKEFGLLAAGSVLAAGAGSLAAFPLAARLAGPAGPLAAGVVWKAIEPVLAGAVGKRALVVRATLLALASAGVLASTIEVDHEPLDLLHAADPLRRTYARLEGSVAGLAPLEVVVDLPARWDDPGTLRLLDAAVLGMEEAAGAGPALGITGPVKLAASLLRGGAPGTYALPESDALLALAAAAVRRSPGSTRRLVAGDGLRARVLLPLNILGGRAHAAASGRVEAAAASRGLRARPAGLIHRLMKSQESVLGAQTASMLIATGAASLFLGAALGSKAQALAALAVNAVSIGLAVAVLAVLRLQLDISIAMVASVALGIAVDDTAHLLWCFLDERGAPPGRALRAIGRAGPGILAKNAVVACGFLVIAAARFPPVSRFGALTAWTLVISMTSHLLLLPAWLARASGESARAPQKARAACPSAA